MPENVAETGRLHCSGIGETAHRLMRGTGSAVVLAVFQRSAYISIEQSVPLEAFLEASTDVNTEHVANPENESIAASIEVPAKRQGRGESMSKNCVPTSAIVCLGLRQIGPGPLHLIVDGVCCFQELRLRVGDRIDWLNGSLFLKGLSAIQIDVDEGMAFEHSDHERDYAVNVRSPAASPHIAKTHVAKTHVAKTQAANKSLTSPHRPSRLWVSRFANMANCVDSRLPRYNNMVINLSSLPRGFLAGSTEFDFVTQNNSSIEPTEFSALRQHMKVAVSELEIELRQVLTTTTTASSGFTASLKLLGAGAGLTPAGDDFLAGVLLTMRVTGQKTVHDSLWLALEENLSARTHVISAAHLREAAQGRIGETTQQILEVAGSDPALFERNELYGLANRLGASSGFDLLSGVIFSTRVIEQSSGHKFGLKFGLRGV